MNRFSIYTIKIFLKYLLIVQFFVTIVSMVSAAYTYLQESFRAHVTLWHIINMEIIKLPATINSSLPISIVVANIVAVLLLVRSNELLAYSSIGGRITRFTIPLILVSFIAALGMYCSYSLLYANTRIAYERYRTEKILKEPYNPLREKVSNLWSMDGSTLVHIDFVDNTQNYISNISEYYMDAAFMISSVRNIEKAVYDNQSGNWEFFNVYDTDLTQKPPITNFTEKTSSTGQLLQDIVAIAEKRQPKTLSLGEISRLIKLMKAKGLSANKHEMILYSRYASTLSVIVLTLLVVPIGITFNRRFSPLRNASIAFGLALAFWITFSAFKSLGESEVLPPFAANFLPHIIFIIAGLFILYKKESAG
ncbi:MAG: LptF/LptG family permease [Deferribacteraceae bacterium]|nr:LptF/LptG family permease [Deferribacteraceae bacterium]